MLGKPVNGYVRPLNRQLMPRNVQIQCSYLHSNVIMYIDVYCPIIDKTTKEVYQHSSVSIKGGVRDVGAIGSDVSGSDVSHVTPKVIPFGASICNWNLGLPVLFSGVFGYVV